MQPRVWLSLRLPGPRMPATSASLPAIYKNVTLGVKKESHNETPLHGRSLGFQLFHLSCDYRECTDARSVAGTNAESCTSSEPQPAAKIAIAANSRSGS